MGRKGKSWRTMARRAVARQQSSTYEAHCGVRGCGMPGNFWGSRVWWALCALQRAAKSVRAARMCAWASRVLV